MANRSRAMVVSQLVTETTAGTAPNSGVYAPWVPPNTKIMMAGAGDPQSVHVPSGHLYPRDLSNSVEWGAGSYEMKMTYDESFLLFNSLFYRASPTGTIPAYQRVWTPPINSLQAFDTYTLESGQGTSGGSVDRFNYLAFNSVKFTVGKQENPLFTGDVIGQEVVPATALSQQGVVSTTFSGPITGNVTPQAVTPAAMTNIAPGSILTINGGGGTAETVTVVSVTGSTFTAIFRQNRASGTNNVTVAAAAGQQTLQSSPIAATSWDLLGASGGFGDADVAFTTGWKLEFNYGPKLSPAFFINSAEGSFDALGVGEPIPNSVNITVSKDVSGSDYTGLFNLAKKRAGTIIYLTVQSLGSIISGATPQTFKLDMCLKTTALPTSADIGPFQGLTFPCKLFVDPASSKALELKTISRTP